MDAVAGPGVSELGEGIVDVVASLRGATSAGWSWPVMIGMLVARTSLRVIR